MLSPVGGLTRTHASLARTLLLALFCSCGVFLLAAAPALADDSVAPQLVALSLSPAHVDTDSADQTITVTMRLTDDQSGVDYATADLTSPGPNYQMVYVRDLKQTSGTALESVYTGTATLPRGSRIGTWTAFVNIYDKAHNYRPYGYPEIDALLGAGTAEVVNDATTADTTAPTVKAFSISPAHVDTTSSAQTLNVSMRIADEQSGVTGHGAWAMAQVTLRSEGDNPQTRTEMVQISSGDAHDGVYTGVATLPKGSRSGVWTAIAVVSDNLDNAANLDMSEQFGAAGLVTNDAAVWDSSPPQVESFTVTPAEFSTEDGPQTFTATAHVTDDLAGVEPIGMVALDTRPLIGSQWMLVGFERISGDAGDGVYQGTFTLPQGAKAGVWTVTCMATDMVGNHGYWSAEDLATEVPGATAILVNTATAQQVTIEQQWVLRGDNCTATFDPGTVVTRASGGAFAFYQLVCQPFAFTADVPTDDLQGEPVATLRLGIPGLDLGFSLPVTVRMQVGDQYNGCLVRIQSLLEGGDAWANESEVAVAGGEAQFTVSHATRFAASVAPATVRRVWPRVCRRPAVVYVAGTGFGKKRGDSVVLLGGKPVKRYWRWSLHGIQFYVPKDARPGRVRVAVRVHGATTPAGWLTIRR